MWLSHHVCSLDSISKRSIARYSISSLCYPSRRSRRCRPVRRPPVLHAPLPNCSSSPAGAAAPYEHPTRVCLPIPFPSLPFPSRCTKSNTQIPNVRYLFSDLTMILPTKFDLFATVVFVFGSDHDFTCYIRSFCNSYWVYMCTPMS